MCISGENSKDKAPRQDYKKFLFKVIETLALSSCLLLDQSLWKKKSQASRETLSRPSYITWCKGLVEDDLHLAPAPWVYDVDSKAKTVTQTLIIVITLTGL